MGGRCRVNAAGIGMIRIILVVEVFVLILAIVASVVVVAVVVIVVIAKASYSDKALIKCTQRISLTPCIPYVRTMYALCTQPQT